MARPSQHDESTRSAIESLVSQVARIVRESGDPQRI